MLKNKCCLYVIISIRFFSITICNLLIEFPSYYSSVCKGAWSVTVFTIKEVEKWEVRRGNGMRNRCTMLNVVRVKNLVINNILTYATGSVHVLSFTHTHARARALAHTHTHTHTRTHTLSAAEYWHSFVYRCIINCSDLQLPRFKTTSCYWSSRSHI